LRPGHGTPIFGALRVRQVLTDTADYLQSLYSQTVALMNIGTPLDEIVRSVEPPAKLIEKPYLQAVYDEPEFIVRNIWRLEAGWYDGRPSHLKPAPIVSQAQEIAQLAGGAAKLVDEANSKFAAGDLAMAAHLIDWAVMAAPEDVAGHTVRMKIYAARAADSRSTMSHGIFRAAAIESAAKAGVAAPEDNRRM
jgi:alkyl sulfatase BDS1-like metallo-beta-lactamase superfamily hydrolase